MATTSKTKTTRVKAVTETKETEKPPFNKVAEEVRYRVINDPRESPKENLEQIESLHIVAKALIERHLSKELKWDDYIDQLNAVNEGLDSLGVPLAHQYHVELENADYHLMTDEGLLEPIEFGRNTFMYKFQIDENSKMGLIPSIALPKAGKWKIVMQYEGITNVEKLIISTKDALQKRWEELTKAVNVAGQ